MRLALTVASQNIDFTFNVVKDIIVKNGLKECGLLVRATWFVVSLFFVQV